MNTALVSVNMPVYNGAAYIRASIESILTQTFTDFELIIVNDGSTDNTVSIIEQFNDPRIRIVHNTQRSGLALVRNTAIRESKGKYIAILDSDDVAYPDRLKIQVDFLEKNPAYCLVCGWADRIDANGNLTGKVEYPFEDKEIAAVLFFHNCIAQSSVMLRKNMLPSTDPYHPAFPPAEDYHLWVQMSKNNPMHIIQQTLIKYRVHGTNTSIFKQEKTNKIVRDILKLQCYDLGLEGLSSDDLGLQIALVFNCYLAEREYMIKLNTFYQKIITTNRKYKRYSPAILESMIKKYMRKPLLSFFVRKKYGMPELKDLFGHTVNASYYLLPKDVFIILIKCILNYKP